jgi:hypothetical protein
MLRVVDSIAQKNSEVNSLLPVQRVNRLYGGVQHLGSVWDYRRIGRVSSRLSLYLPQPEKQRLSRGLDIGQMDVVPVTVWDVAAYPDGIRSSSFSKPSPAWGLQTP